MAGCAIDAPPSAQTEDGFSEAYALARESVGEDAPVGPGDDVGNEDPVICEGAGGGVEAVGAGAECRPNPTQECINECRATAEHERDVLFNPVFYRFVATFCCAASGGVPEDLQGNCAWYGDDHQEQSQRYYACLDDLWRNRELQLCWIDSRRWECERRCRNLPLDGNPWHCEGRPLLWPDVPVTTPEPPPPPPAPAPPVRPTPRPIHP